jgi:hypothetical protein
VHDDDDDDDDGAGEEEWNSSIDFGDEHWDWFTSSPKILNRGNISE